jgi:hypothetical protein
VSHSFTVRADDKEAIAAAVAANLDEIDAHEGDRASAEAAFEALLTLVQDPEADENIQVSINVYRMTLEEGMRPSSLSLSVTVNILSKMA